jgi:O-6-methylguanine DNA methyltransferase
MAKEQKDHDRDHEREQAALAALQSQGTSEGQLSAMRRLASELHGLGAAEAPATLLPEVLFRVGLGDRYTMLATPLGVVYVAYNGRGISAVQRASDAAAFAAAFRACTGRPLAPEAAADAELRRKLEDALRGARRGGLRFDLRGLSEFEQAVLLKALEIPRGEVRPYGWVAREIGRPRAVRAVGSALGRNPVPLLIPCHRVVRSDGTLGAYSMGGPEAKRTILTAEAVDTARLEALAHLGVHYLGSDTTRIYCLPTCRHSRQASEAHRVSFSSREAAAAAGYRPCKVCRPA